VSNLFLPGVGTPGTPATPKVATAGRYLILYSYFNNQSSILLDQLRLTIAPGPSYGKTVYPAFRGTTDTVDYIPFFPLPGALPPSAEGISMGMAGTDGTIAGNSSYNGLAGWVSPLFSFIGEEGGHCAEQYMALSIDTLVNNSPKGGYPTTKTTNPLKEPYLTLTINPSNPSGLYRTLFTMCATVETLFAFDKWSGEDLGIIVTEAVNGYTGVLWNDESMLSNDLPPNFNTRATFPGGGVSFVPDVYSPEVPTPFVDVTNFTNGTFVPGSVTLGLTSLKFNVS
jgi:hypothetical protein